MRDFGAQSAVGEGPREEAARLDGPRTGPLWWATRLTYPGTESVPRQRGYPWGSRLRRSSSAA